MPRIPVHSAQDAPEQARQTLEHLAAKMGKVLNIHGEMAHSPVVLATYAAMQQAIAEHGSFDARTCEAIALAVGNQNGCDYGQSAHTLSARKAGFSEQETVAIRSGQPDNAKLATLLTLAHQIAGNVGEVDDAGWKQALDAGWSDIELAAPFAHVAANLYTNYFNHYAGTELDIPAAPSLS